VYYLAHETQGDSGAKVSEPFIKSFFVQMFIRDLKQSREMALENSNDDKSKGAGMDPSGIGDGEINVDTAVGKNTDIALWWRLD
jgi:hypothetical protein